MGVDPVQDLPAGVICPVVLAAPRWSRISARIEIKIPTTAEETAAAGKQSEEPEEFMVPYQSPGITDKPAEID